MFARLKYYLTIAYKRYHFIIPLSHLKRFIKNHFTKGYYIFKPSSYKKWLKEYYPVESKKVLSYKPLISVIIPVYNIKRKYLVECIESVLNQSYDNFEICIVDDASTLKETIDTLKEYENNNKIKIKYHKKNMHISKASNDAVSMASGDYIALLDDDDFITQNALYEVVSFINNHMDAELIYSDEDKVTADGKVFHTPVLKPDFSPEYFLHANYICHFTVIKKSTFEKVNGFRVGYEGVQDWDLFARIIEKTNKIYHIPRILYHWRELDPSTAFNVNSKPYVVERTKKIIEEQLIKKKINAKLLYIKDNIYYIKFDKKNEFISFILHGTHNYDRCIQSIVDSTEALKYEIIINKNDIAKRELSIIKNKYKNIVVIDCIKNKKSTFINNASKKSKGDYLLFLDSNVVIQNKDFINQLLGYASLDHAGAVGTNINIDNKYICHGNIIYNNETIQEELHDSTDDKYGVYSKLIVPHNVMVVKDTCLMISKEKFNKIKGYDSSLDKYADVDFCLKLFSSGYYNVIEPNVCIYSDCSNLFPKNNKEKDIICKKWGNKYINDPFYNINLDDKKMYYLRCHSFNNEKHVFIIGSRGYCFNYGGWETFITNLMDYYDSDKIIFHISGIGPFEDHLIKNNHCYIDIFPLNRFGKMQMYFHTRKSIKYYEKYIKQHKLGNCVIYILGLKLGTYLKFKHKKLNKLGIKIMVNPDGLEWKRKKYGIIGKLFFLISERSMLHNCDLIICDAKGIYNYIVHKYKRNKIEKKIITYGTIKYTDYLKPNELFNKYNIKNDNYLLVVGRLVPENNLDFIINEFKNSKIQKKLVIVTNESYDNFLVWCKNKKVELDDRIVFLGPIYNKQDIYSLRHYAYAYIHGHSVGGTNPSLLESLYASKFIIAYNVNFNKDVCRDSAIYFDLKKGSLTRLLNNYKKYDLKRSLYHKKAINIINTEHTWEYIAKEYKYIWEGK